MRIGHGYDVHAFGVGDKIVIGGVAIPHSHGPRLYPGFTVTVKCLSSWMVCLRRWCLVA